MKKEDYKRLFSYLGVNQKEFAEKFNIHAPHLSDIVNGKLKGLPKEIMIQLKREYGISLEWLMTGEGEMLNISGKDSLSEEEIEVVEEMRRDKRLVGLIRSFLEAIKINLK
ncbi:MAG: helix-turn-helix domain-containing protein [Leptospiraceae bacterium]|nr:helix-turn-helix domain-containing protein [Leptospiraceae bacterium]MCP5498690.1 helix-turn-helix domain-containing protein [Leptospiraceae bacterium]